MTPHNDYLVCVCGAYAQLAWGLTAELPIICCWVDCLLALKTILFPAF